MQIDFHKIEDIERFYRILSDEDLEIIKKAEEIFNHYLDFQKTNKVCRAELEKPEVMAVFKRLKNR
ncbi:hypothetical protein CCY99_06095 [Helicobacter sp. 16-1353]|uniref:hypothetical protein n=1 Tax=Helicobacter sp. 16-1353 TaxID=2004996 RepID=UPI000DCCA17F|nr:hypothetical protein [Helicobacter sp. 16-1353]RAX53161.1 hypothetical protein CCY99_06095 [Helicobacter sp. 16-1353]